MNDPTKRLIDCRKHLEDGAVVDSFVRRDGLRSEHNF
jgi:hypothetical protein